MPVDAPVRQGSSQSLDPYEDTIGQVPVTLRDPHAVRRDVANLKAALQDPSQAALMSAASPGVIDTFMPTTYYASNRQYLTELG